MKQRNLLLSKVILCGTLFMGMCTSKIYAQKSKPVKILFLLDGSSSMLDDWQPGEQRFKTAGKLIISLMDSIKQVNPNVQFGLRVFGHQYPTVDSNCTDSKLEVAFSMGNYNQMNARLKYISARGVSPIAYSLEKTAEQNFPNSQDNAYSIILLTDGGESCGGNICGVINTLLANKISFKPYILSLIDNYDLRKEYECFGKFLPVTKPDQIAPAIKTIIDDNRTMFEKNDGNLAKVVLSTPDTAKPEVIKPVTIDTLVKPKTTINNIANSKQQKLQTLPYKKLGFIRKPAKALPALANIKFIEEETSIPAVKPTPVLKAKIAKIEEGKKIYKIKRFPQIFIFKEDKPATAIAKPLKIQFLPEEPAPVSVATNTPKETIKPKPTPKSTTPPPVKSNEAPKEAPVEIAKEASDDTKILVYFTNGKGRFYKTETKIDFLDIKTNKVVQSNYRFVNKKTGEPEPIKIPPGSYRVVKQTGHFKTQVITIEANTTSKVTMVVPQGSFKFMYLGNEKRKVIEYTASINNPTEKNKWFTQNCDTMIEYDPGIYHIEINTLPPTVAAVPDLQFGETYPIYVKEPGVLIVNTTEKAKVMLWYQRGISFEPFYEMVLNGNPANQKLELQPGPYIMYYFKNGKEHELKFQIKSNTETPVSW